MSPFNVNGKNIFVSSNDVSIVLNFSTSITCLASATQRQYLLQRLVTFKSCEIVFHILVHRKKLTLSVKILEAGDVLIGTQLRNHLSQTLNIYMLKKHFINRKNVNEVLRDLPERSHTEMVEETYPVSLRPVSSPNLQVCLWGC